MSLPVARNMRPKRSAGKGHWLSGARSANHYDLYDASGIYMASLVAAPRAGTHGVWELRRVPEVVDMMPFKRSRKHGGTNVREAMERAEIWLRLQGVAL